MSRQIPWKNVRREILRSSNWIVHLDKDDLNTFEGGDDDCILTLESSTSDLSEKRFALLSDMIEQKIADRNLDSITKIILFVQFPLSSPIMITEMNKINQLIDYLIPEGKDCEIKWGLSPREDDVTRIVCAMR